MKVRRFVAVLAAGAVVSGGCGGSGKTHANVLPESARRPVLHLLGALQGGPPTG